MKATPPTVELVVGNGERGNVNDSIVQHLTLSQRCSSVQRSVVLFSQPKLVHVYKCPYRKLLYWFSSISFFTTKQFFVLHYLTDKKKLSSSLTIVTILYTFLILPVCYLLYLSVTSLYPPFTKKYLKQDWVMVQYLLMSFYQNI